MGRPPCCDKANVKRGLWTAEEDAKILAYVANHGVGNWTLVPQKAGLNRCGKSCRLRWTNYLRPDLKHENFTPQEEQLILDLHEAIGSRWSLIAKQLPGRTDNDVKNFWNTKLRKKLSKMGIDPITHKPYSQILTDYGNISGLPNSRNQIGPYNNSINIPIPKPDPSPISTGPSNTMIEQVQPHFFNEISYSTSSSSSSCSTVKQMGTTQPSRVQMTHPFSSGWILGDPYLINGTIEEYNFQDMLSSGSELQNVNGIDGSGQTNKQCSEAASSSSNTFLEAMFDKDCEMQMEFPEIFSLLSS